MGLFRRLVTLLCVSIVAGCVGLVGGFLLAPAPGHETRAVIQAFIEEHGPSVTAQIQEGISLITNAVDYVTAQVNSNPADEGLRQ